MGATIMFFVCLFHFCIMCICTESSFWQLLYKSIWHFDLLNNINVFLPHDRLLNQAELYTCSPLQLFFLHRNVFSIIPLCLLLSPNFVGPYYFINLVSHVFCYIFSLKTLIYVINYRYILFKLHRMIWCKCSLSSL